MMSGSSCWGQGQESIAAKSGRRTHEQGTSAPDDGWHSSRSHQGGICTVPRGQGQLAGLIMGYDPSSNLPSQWNQPGSGQPTRTRTQPDPAIPADPANHSAEPNTWPHSPSFPVHQRANKVGLTWIFKAIYTFLAQNLTLRIWSFNFESFPSCTF